MRSLLPRSRGASASGGALLVALSLLALGGCAGQAPPDERPSVVVISIDTLSARALRAFAEAAPAHPRLDGLAAESVRFQEAIAPSGWTLPSHASLLTGLYPDRHGATDPKRRIADQVPTAAEVFRTAGYQTVGFTDAGYVSDHFGFARGFDVYNELTDGGSLRGVPRRGRPARVRGAALFDRAAAWLGRREPGAGPLFLFVQTFAVHDYFKVHDWAAEALPAFPDRAPSDYLDGLLGKTTLPPEAWERLRSLYAAEVVHLDAGLARLFDALRDAGVTANLYVAFTSDHGEGFSPELGRIHHGGRLERDLLHVPLLISGPDIAPRDVHTPVSLVDVLPTLLDLAGVAVPAGLDGRSLASVARGETQEPATAPIFAMEHHLQWVEGRRVATDEPLDAPLSMGVVAGSRWLLRDEHGERAYDLVEDPEQRRPLPASAPGLDELRERMAGRSHALPSVAQAPLDPELLEQLESLGYVH